MTKFQLEKAKKIETKKEVKKNAMLTVILITVIKAMKEKHKIVL